MSSCHHPAITASHHVLRHAPNFLVYLCSRLRSHTSTWNIEPKT